MPRPFVDLVNRSGKELSTNTYSAINYLNSDTQELAPRKRGTKVCQVGEKKDRGREHE